MAGISRVKLGTVVCAMLMAGCSHSSSTGNATSTGGEKTALAVTQSNPIARVTSEWLDAVLKGDTQRASARLTPQAMQRIIDSGKQFSPPGVDVEGFQIGDVQTPTPDQAVVPCVLNYTTDGKHHSEELCCLLRRVDNDWRVSGIAYGTTPDKPWVWTNFETGKDTAVSRQDMGDSGPAAAVPNDGASRPSPPHTAQETPTASPPAERR